MLGLGFCPILSAGKEDIGEYVECIASHCEWWDGTQCNIGGLFSRFREIEIAISKNDSSVELTSILSEIEEINSKLAMQEE